MNKKASIKYINHPRYGNKPIPSNYQFSEEEINNAYWYYRSLTTFAETAIPADISKQQYAIYPRKLYVDIAETCRGCGNNFIFFAKEQQHWFEELGFWVDAHCVHCIDCRKQNQAINKMQKRYQALVTCNKRSESETKELRDIANELYQLGYIKDTSKLKIKKRQD